MSRLSVASADKVNSTTEQLMKEFTQRIVANPPGVCPVDMQLAFLKVCHAQTCGKCVPCRVGLGQLERLLEKVLDNEATMETLELIEETAENIKNSADCAIGFESARMVLAGLEGFREDYISHITDHRCLGSFEQPIPCVTLCPAHVDIPGYIALAGEGRCEDAVRLIRKDNPFPTACALICEHPCEARCRRNIIDDSINIRGMKRYIVDNAPSDKVPVPACAPSTGKKVAIIGGGPSGLTSAYFLQLMGHQCTVFEEKKQLGGMLRYGIPNYRFPRERLQEDINAILSTGVDVKLNTTIGTEELKQIQQEYDAIYVAIGAHTDKKLGLEGEDSKNVISAVDMLREIGDGAYPDYTGKTCRCRRWRKRSYGLRENSYACKRGDSKHRLPQTSGRYDSTSGRSGRCDRRGNRTCYFESSASCRGRCRGKCMCTLGTASDYRTGKRWQTFPA